MTLVDLQVRHDYNAQLEFYDETPHPGPILVKQPDDEDLEEDDEDYGEQHDWYYDGVYLILASFPFPRFRPADVLLPYDDPATIFDIIPKKVFVNGVMLYYKRAWILEDSARAIEKYQKILASGHPPEELRTSRLYGIVIDSRGVLCGLLCHWIDVQNHLTWDVLDASTEESRTKWMEQIQGTVSILHGPGICWGNVQPTDVVIDSADNTIITDLKGGASKGWIDKDNMDTLGGDLQRMERLIDYITNDQCLLRVEDKKFDLELEQEASGQGQQI